MSTKVAPWLQGLGETWEVPAGLGDSNNISSASHDARSIHNRQHRIPRRSLSGLQPSLDGRRTSSNSTTQVKRSPLAPLNSSSANSFRRLNGSVKLASMRSVPYSSGGSTEDCGTVQQRSKSASPAKKQETLEWKRRLVCGEVDYGDQTDLFAPSGLENLFARSKGQGNDVSKPKSPMSWLPTSDAQMPSSPPPWPSSFGAQQSARVGHASLERVHEENSEIEWNSEEQEADGSFRSNPFDLHNTDECEEECESNASGPKPNTAAGMTGEFAGNRTLIGQTELEQEDFSPVFISKHTTVNGQIDYAALDSRLMKQFHTTNVNLSHSDLAELPPMGAVKEISGEIPADQAHFIDGPQSDSAAANADFSLSENLPTGTPPAVSLGRNVELKRGGYSAYGSFKQRPLSPSPSKEEESLLPGETENAPPILSDRRPLPPAPTPPHVPTTPLRPVALESPKSRSSGSPLKLFAAHDTFTNNRLLRRMSQLDPEGNPLVDEQPTTPSEVDVMKRNQGPDKPPQDPVRNSFGSGDLKRVEFAAEITITSPSDSDPNGSDCTPDIDISVPGSQVPLNFCHKILPEVNDAFKAKRKLSKQSAAHSSKNSTMRWPEEGAARLKGAVEDASELEAYYERAGQVRSYEGNKRPPTSPFKNPTPKRRRTLHALELEDEIAEAARLQETASSRKRKDVRQGDERTVADADVLAARKTLRPRNPTPSQRRRQQIEAEVLEAAEEFAAQEPEKLDAVIEQIESSIADSDGPGTLQQQAETVAAEVASFTLRVQKPSSEHGPRKPSVTTQDFLNEAMMVMQFIRAKAQPRSNLGSVEESEAERLNLGPESSLMSVSSPLRVSRPPSREGGHSGWRSGTQSQTDSRVMSHLRKFQEKDDTEFIAQSVASLHVDDDDSVKKRVVAVDEESNIRITSPPAEMRSWNEEYYDSRPTSQRSQDNTMQTQQSVGTSTGRTVGTGSTRKSDQVGTLAPDDVAHLIGEQIGGMVYDKCQKCWLRVKGPEKKEKSGFLEPPSNITSDDDPFREISDLAVDEREEARRVSSADKTTITATECPTEVEGEPKADENIAQQQSASDHLQGSGERAISRPVTRDSIHMQSRIHQVHTSSVTSQCPAFASSQQEKAETRATSWNDDKLAKLTAMGEARQKYFGDAAAQVTSALPGGRDTVVKEPSAGTGEVDTCALEPTKPDAVIFEGLDVPVKGSLEDSLDEDKLLGEKEPEIGAIRSPRLRQSMRTPLGAPPSTLRGHKQHVSLRKQTLMNGFTNNTHEHSELSLITALPGERMMSVSLSVSRPITTRHETHLATLESSPSKPDPNGTFLWSDLNDFTVHEEDEERPSERALGARLAQHAAAEVNDRYALTVKDLVKTLTDVEEAEPYWEDLRKLDLRNRSLVSIYGLNDFCGRIQEMNVSENALTQLHGAPMTIRRLSARYNRLSGLTHWSHLANLQSLDISNNHLDNLDGLSSLIHLRELTADDNQIKNLDGLMELDGLLKLRLRRNKLHRVDFTGSRLHRLADIDLSGNGICEVENIEQLFALEKLCLDDNLLQTGLQVNQCLPKLELLSLRNCALGHLDVSMMPGLRQLDVDENCLPTIAGVERLPAIEILSMRRQSLPEGTRISVLNQVVEARSVRLSGNTMPSLSLVGNFLNLQHLELMSVGLLELPDDFGLRMPNLRTLDLNFNLLKDIKPLLNIQRLEELRVCGNRIDRLRRTMATLSKLATVKKLDFRENPVTQGFYAPAVTVQTGIVRRAGPSHWAEEDESDKAMEFARYCLPNGDATEDKQHLVRIDEETRLKRRVYEILLVNSCPSLKHLDGLVFDRASANVKDYTWDRLVELRVLRKSQQV